MRIVWHGHYIKYFEDGREAFGNKYNINYMDVYRNNLLTPVVQMNIDYKRPLLYGESAVVETKFIDSEAAKIIFEYTLFREPTNEIIATAKSVQVFLNKDRELLLTVPTFYLEWKKKWGLIK